MPAAQKAPQKPKSTPGAATGVKKGDHVFLVDGSGYIFRAYHALPPITRKSDGLQLNAVFGFCNMLWKLLRDMKADDKPTHLAVVFDKSEKTFRTEMYKEYKAHRPDPPDDLIPQFKFIREAVAAFDLPCLEQGGFEADDLIATYARLASEAGATTSIVSSDKDLMQLVSDRVTMFDTMKDKKIGRDEVIEKFGVPPEKVIEVQALIGDSTDNVPGVPGIGVKTAAQLIGEYGDLETLLKRANEIKQDKRRQTLLDNADAARMSKKLVTLDTNVKLDVPIEDLAVHEPDYKNLIAFLKAMEFSSLTRRVAEFASIDVGAIEPAAQLAGGARAATSGTANGKSQSNGAAPSPQLPLGRPAQPGDMSRQGRTEAPQYPALTPKALTDARRDAARAAKFDRSRYETVRSVDRLKAWVERAWDVGQVALHASSVSIDPMQAELCGVALAVAPNEACYVPLSHRQGGEGAGLFRGDIAADQIPEAQALEVLKPLLEDPGVLKIGHDLKFTWQIFAQRGIEIVSYDDIILMSYVADAGVASHALESLAERTFSHAALDINELIKAGKARITFDAVGIDRATEYSAERADIIFRVWQVLAPRLAADKVRNVYETLERPLLSVLGHMERRGISVDRNVLSRLSGEFAQEAAGLEDEINKLAGETVNVGSPKQIGDILFGKMQLPGGTKTKTGQWSTGARQLEELAEMGHELPRKIIDWRQVSKLKSTYTDALPEYVNPTTKRVHTSYALAATTTGRLSSSEPNLQNIPVRTEDGRKIRRAPSSLSAGPGMKLVSADYSCRSGGCESFLPPKSPASQSERTVAEGVPRRPHRHLPHSRLDGPTASGDVRRAGEGHGGYGNPPPRQGDQLRRHRTSYGISRRSAALPISLVSSARRQAALISGNISERFPGIRDATTWRRPRSSRRITQLHVETAVRPQMPGTIIRISRRPNASGSAPEKNFNEARRDQCAAARHRSGHHPPRHDPHGLDTDQEKARRANAAASARRAGV